jgi:hypothetical protein
VAALRGLVDVGQEVEGDVQPLHADLRLFVELLEVETAEVLEEVIARVDLLDVELLQFEGPEFPQFLVAEIECLLRVLLCFFFALLVLCPNERPDFPVGEHILIFKWWIRTRSRWSSRTCAPSNPSPRNRSKS